MLNVKNRDCKRSALAGKLSLLLTLAITFMLLVGCSSGLDITGKWQSEAEFMFLDTIIYGDTVTFDGEHTDLVNRDSMEDSYQFGKTDGNNYQITVMDSQNRMSVYKLKAVSSNEFFFVYGGLEYPFVRVK